MENRNTTCRSLSWENDRATLFGADLFLFGRQDANTSMSFFTPTAATGNGLCLATFGRCGELMSFFYPRIDYAQNVREGMPAVRLLDGSPSGKFLWCFEDAWRVAQSFESASNILVTRLAHQELDLTIEISDVLVPGHHALFRRVGITKSEHVCPVQFMHYFRLTLGDVEWRNGVQAHPEQNAVVQHFRDTTIAISAAEPFAAQCSSVKHIGASPTKDAMLTGHLGTSPQAIGRVDFAIGFEPVTSKRWRTTLVLAGAPSREDALARVNRLTTMGFEAAVRQANDRVAAELNDAGKCPVPELADAFDRAVISLHDLYDESQGTFIAAPEFDLAYELSGGYGYCWPRDAAACALAAQRIGRPGMAQRFFKWSARTQLASGYWFQRYWTDGSAAPSWCVHADKIQLDQTCAILHAAGLFARRLGESADAFIESYRPVAERATRAILKYIGDNHLHRPSTDLWENSVGTFTYTQAAVIAALREAHEVFEIDLDRTGPAVRNACRQQLIDTFWQKDRRRWLRRITPEGHPDPTLDSSAIGIIEPWDILDLQDPNDRQLAIETIDGISQDLRSEVKGGQAILRFSGESYMGGGPGCVNTLWLALCRIRLAATATTAEQRTEQLQLALADIRIALANTSPTGQLPELIPKMDFDYWAAPHGWACSLLIEAVCAFRSINLQNETVFDAERSRIRRRAPSC